MTRVYPRPSALPGVEAGATWYRGRRHAPRAGSWVPGILSLMASHPYDRVSLERLRARPGAKWKYYPEDVLPLWVAEMDFPLAEAVKDAIRERLDADDLGYPMPDGVPGFRGAVVARFAARFGVSFAAARVALVGPAGTSLALAARAFAGLVYAGLFLSLLAPLF